MTPALEKLKAFRGQLLADEPLARHTSLKVGGPADIFAIPEDKRDLQTLLQLLDAHKTPWFVIGGGYNLLVKDGGFRGVVISLKNLNRVELVQGNIYAEAGATNQALACLARDNGLGGLEFLIGIPGTVGGALMMNAGAHGGEIMELVETIEIFGDGNSQKYPRKSLDYGYRRLQLGSNKIIIAAEFRLARAAPEAISSRMDECLQKRRQTQAVGFPNAGSFFKNPASHAAWQLIDQTGLRGTSCGGAQVSEIHANFLVNRGNASASDFLELAALVKEKVFEQSGIMLQEEVKIIGE